MRENQLVKITVDKDGNEIRVYRNILRDIPPDFGEKKQIAFTFCLFRKVKKKAGTFKQVSTELMSLNHAVAHSMTMQTSTRGEDTRYVACAVHLFHVQMISNAFNTVVFIQIYL